PCVASHSFNLQNSAVSRIPVRDAVQSEKLLRNPSHVSSYHPSVHLRPIAVLLTPKEKPDINRLQQTCAVIAPHFRIRFSLGEFMKTKNVIAVVLFALVTGCFAQSSSPEAHRSNAQIIDFILDFQEKRLLDIAEAMPAEKYTFTPSAGEFKGVRTF